MRSETVVPSPHGHHKPKAPGAPAAPPQKSSCDERTPPHPSASLRTSSGAPASVWALNDVGSSSVIAARAAGSRLMGMDEATQRSRRSYDQSAAGHLLL